MKYVADLTRNEKPRDALAWLQNSPLAPGPCAMAGARDFHDWMTAEAKRFLAKRGHSYPAPDHILNPRGRWEGGRRG